MNLADAVMAIHASDLDAQARLVLFAVACAGVDLGDGRRAWTGSVPALASASRVSEGTVKRALKALGEGGMFETAEVSGRPARCFDFNAIGSQRSETGSPRSETGSQGTGSQRSETGSPRSETGSHRSGLPASRVHTRDSLLVQEPYGSCTGGEREVVDHLAGEREREAHTHPLLGDPDESAALPVIELDPEAPQSLTPPPPAWAPVEAPPSSPPTFQATGRASGYATGPAAPGRAYTPGPHGFAPSAEPPAFEPTSEGLRRALTPPPAGFEPQAFTDAQVVLMRELWADFERALKTTTLPLPWERAVRNAVSLWPADVVCDVSVGLLGDVERGLKGDGYAHKNPQWLGQRCRELAKLREKGGTTAPAQRGAMRQRRAPQGAYAKNILTGDERRAAVEAQHGPARIITAEQRAEADRLAQELGF